MADPQEEAATTQASTIHDLVAPHIQSFVTLVEGTQEKILKLAHQAESFPIDTNTANLVASLAHTQIKGLSSFKDDLQRQFRDFDRQVNLAARAVEKSEQTADEKAKAFEAQTKSLKENEEEVHRILREYKARLAAIENVQTQFESIIPRLAAAQENASIQENLVMDLGNTIKQSNANHQETLDDLRKQHDENVQTLQNQKSEAESKAAESEKTSRLLQADIDKLRSIPSNTSGYAEMVAVQTAVEREKILAGTLFDLEKKALKDAHEGEILRLNDLHKSSINRLEHLIREEQAANKKLTAKNATLDKDVAVARAQCDTISKEKEQKKQECLGWAQQLWDSHHREFINSTFFQFQSLITTILNQFDQDLKANQGRTDQVLQNGETWNQRVNEIIEEVHSELTEARKTHLTQMSVTAARLDEYLAENKKMLAEGTSAAGTARVTKKHFDTALKAVEILDQADQYRDKADMMVRERDAEIQTMGTQIADHIKQINELTEELKQCKVECAKTKQLQDQVEQLTQIQLGNIQVVVNSYDEKLKASESRIEDLNKGLGSQSNTLKEKEDLLAGLRSEIVAKNASIYDLRKRLDEVKRDLDECKARKIAAATRDQMQGESLNEQLTQAQKLLDECNAPKAVNDFKAQEYDKLVSPYQELEKLKDEVNRLQQERRGQQHTASESEPGDTIESPLPRERPSASTIRGGTSYYPGVRTAFTRAGAPPFRVIPGEDEDSTSSSQGPSTIRRAIIPTTPAMRAIESVFNLPITVEPADPSVLNLSSNIGSTSTLPQISSGGSASQPSTAVGLAQSSLTTLGKRPVQRTPSSTPAHVKYATAEDRSRIGMPRDISQSMGESIAEDTGTTRQSGMQATPSAGIAGPSGAHTISDTTGEDESQARDGSATVTGEEQLRRRSHGTTAHKDLGESSTVPRIGGREGTLIGDDDSNLEPPDLAEDDTTLTLGDDDQSSLQPDSSMPAPRRPGERDWRRDGVIGGDRRSIIFSQIVKPANWTEEVNQDLIRVVTNPARKLPVVVEDFLSSPLCMSAAQAKQPVIKEDQTEPCDWCKDNNKLCWGLKILPGTAPPSRAFRRGQKSARTDYVTNTEGHYWEAVLRSARGPDEDDDMAGGGDGVTAA